MGPGMHNLNQDITHWPVTGSDGYGGHTYGTPVKLSGRWEDKQELFITQEREEIMSNAILYLSIATAVGDYFGEGDLTATADPSTLSDTYRSRAGNKTTSLRSLEAIRKVIL